MSIYDKSSLVLIPSGTKTGKVYSQKPVNGDGDFTFSRSTAATRVNADGNIEKETQNLFTQSNDFDGSDWSAVNLNVTSGQAGYDGTNDAFLFTATNNNARVTQNPNISGVQTFSVYAKAGVTNWVRLRVDFSGSIADGYFALHTGALGSTTNCIDSNITDVGGGWYRCSITYNQAITAARIYVTNNDGSSGASGDSAYIQDAQLEQGLVARDYIETTTAAVEGGITDNVPRLDYTDSSCPALLLEPQRTNQILYSEYQSGGGFALGPNITWNGFVESPEGVSNASRFTSNVQGFSYVAAQGVVIPSGDFTFSMWVRGVSGTFLNRPLNIAGLSGTSLVYMNETPVAGEDWKLVYGAGNNTGSAVTKTITLPFYDQPVGSVLEIYGFQLEAGSYATSYIPTYGTSVTRNEDTATSNLQITNTNNFSIYIEFDSINKTDEGYGASSITFPSTTGGYWGRLYPYYTNEAVRWLLRGDGVSINIYHYYNPASTKIKTLITYDGSDYKVYANGSLKYTWSETAYTMSTGQSFNITKMANEGMLTFNQALSNEEAIALTTI